MLQTVLKILPAVTKNGLSFERRPIVITFSTNSLTITDEHRFHDTIISKRFLVLYSTFIYISTY